MTEASPKTNNNLRLISTPPTTPSELDKVLHLKIQEYMETYSWRQLAAAVKEFVQDQFKPAYRFVSEGKITPEELEAEIKSHIPSRTYIEDYAKGRPICYRYTNTLANFFQQEYILHNHNPCQQYLHK
jgi:hypothetical protein